MAQSNKSKDSPKRHGDKMNQSPRDQSMGEAERERERPSAEDLDTESFTEGHAALQTGAGETDQERQQRRAAGPPNPEREPEITGEEAFDPAKRGRQAEALEREDFLDTAEEEGVGPEGSRVQRDMHGLQGGRVEERDQDIARGRSSGMSGSDSQRAQHRGGNRGSGATGGQRSHGGRKSTKR
jgi:hypothetical protein